MDHSRKKNVSLVPGSFLRLYFLLSIETDHMLLGKYMYVRVL